MEWTLLFVYSMCVMHSTTLMSQYISLCKCFHLHMIVCLSLSIIECYVADWQSLNVWHRGGDIFSHLFSLPDLINVNHILRKWCIFILFRFNPYSFSNTCGFPAEIYHTNRRIGVCTRCVQHTNIHMHNHTHNGCQKELLGFLPKAGGQGSLETKHLITHTQAEENM